MIRTRFFTIMPLWLVASWQHFIELSPDFTAQERVAMETSLDFIEKSQDAEGLLLMQAAYQNNGGRRIYIAPSEDDEITGNVPHIGVIALNMKAVRTLQVQDERGWQHMSLNGIVVHELYHMTQDLEAKMNAQAAIMRLAGKRFPEKDLPAVLAYLDAWQRSEEYLHTASFIREGQTMRAWADYGMALEKKRAELAIPFDDQLLDIIENTFNRSIRRTNRNTQDWTEQEATDFTDIFMAKNTGGREPWRSTYDNVRDGDTLSTPILYTAANIPAKDATVDSLTQSHLAQSTPVAIRLRTTLPH